MAIPFVLDEKEMQSLKEFAEKEENRFSLAQLQQMARGEIAIPGDRPEYTRNLPFGFKVVYSYEMQSFGWTRHMSMSLAVDGRVPHPFAINMVLEALGFKSTLVPLNTDQAVYADLKDEIFEIIEAVEPLPVKKMGDEEV